MSENNQQLPPQAAAILKQYFGYDEFRKGQEELIGHLLSGRDVLGIMPTGAGKSLCYQIPALMLPGITLVVSPLISLMKDQVTALNQAGIHAAWLNSSLTLGQYAKALYYARQGRYKIIYVAPERLLTDSFLDFACHTEISMVAVDEAHCASQWGQDFRPSYLKIPQFLSALSRRPVVGAFTATAARRVQQDIQEILKLRQPHVALTGFNRENLYFEVRKPGKKETELLEFMEQHKGESGIIYCSTRKGVEEIHQLLFTKGYSVTRYHAGLSEAERARNQEDFVYDNLPVMVATNAFGMGIDKSNVRFVLHYNMPKDLESYYQEAGRAGRDGEPAECVLFYGKKDVSTAQLMIRSGQREELDEEQRQLIVSREQERLKKMNGYCLTQNCLRRYILDYFGDDEPCGCGNCSNCLKEFEETDIQAEAQVILECVQESRQRYGAGVILDTVKGRKTTKVVQYHLERIPQYGKLAQSSLKWLEQAVNFLTVENYLDVSGGDYPVLRLTEKGRQWMEAPGPLWMKVEKEKAREKTASAAGKSGKQKAGSGSLSSGENQLFFRLKELRMEIAREQKVPAYIVFTDKTLVEMAMKKPVTPAQLLQISGVGESKLEKYGERFLRLLNS